eukprot:jgi/Botrbrau1/18690/Bobra.0386s0018.1
MRALVQAFALLSCLRAIHLFGAAAESSASAEAQGQSDVNHKRALRREDSGEIIHKTDFFLDVTNGYAWFNYGKNKWLPPPQPIPDPAFKFSDWGWAAILIGSFVGPYGPFDYAMYALQGQYFGKDGKRLETGRITQSWASHPMYCGRDSPFGDFCTPSVWNWSPSRQGCETLSIYEQKNLKNPILKITNMCKIPGIYIPVPNTTWYIPRKSALRLFMMQVLSSVVDGTSSDGSPKVVDHTLFDFDMEDIATWATFEKMEGPTVGNFTQDLIPLGFNLLNGGKVRTGVYYISPDQQTF